MKFEEIQNRKLISAYGGVGSIIETRHGAVRINLYNDWPFYQTNRHRQEANHVQDERFRARLQLHFPNLKQLVRLPENKLLWGGYTPESQRDLVSATYFPKWMYCTSCNTFNDVDHWRQHWENIVAPQHREKFHPPKCYKCYANPEKSHRFYDLEQVRFVMTSAAGNLVDVPWKHWALRGTNQGEADGSAGIEEEGNNVLLLDLNTIYVPDDVELKYRTSSRFSDLKGIRIEAYSDNKRIGATTLAGIFSLRVTESQHPDLPGGSAQLKTVLRSSNSIYYPNISQSIFLPLENLINAKVIDKIKKRHALGRDTKTIWQGLEDDDIAITLETVQAIIDNDFKPALPPAQSEEQYRWEEYKFICDNQGFTHQDLVFKAVPKELYQVPEINNIHSINRLRVTAVQTAFTRQRPIDKDAFLDAHLEGDIKRKYTTQFGERTFDLPAYESYGEGIFIDLNAEMLKEWEQMPQVKNRIAMLENNFKNSYLGQNQNKNISPRFVLIHTLSHLLIKELEFLCGYPAASLQERLYISNNMQGLLIYTVAGAEGSFGGLVSICKSDRIGTLIRAALDRAKDCASDPICFDTDQQGQGTAGLNLAACYSCGLLPETSCEEMNLFLDRWLAIDSENGFFKTY